MRLAPSSTPLDMAPSGPRVRIATSWAAASSQPLRSLPLRQILSVNDPWSSVARASAVGRGKAFFGAAWHNPGSCWLLWMSILFVPSVCWSHSFQEMRDGCSTHVDRLASHACSIVAKQVRHTLCVYQANQILSIHHPPQQAATPSPV